MISTYAFLGIPESLASVLVLVCLSLSLTPWLGGLEVGPLKVPRIEGPRAAAMKLFAPLGFFLTIAGFYPIWNNNDSDQTAVVDPQISREEYLESYFDPSVRTIKGSLLAMTELETQWMEHFLGGSTWDGGKHWGKIQFQQGGRVAKYTNEPGRAPGQILVQGAPLGTAPVLLAEWSQEDGQSGRVLLGIGTNDELSAVWGPSRSIRDVWTRVSATPKWFSNIDIDLDDSE